MPKQTVVVDIALLGKMAGYIEMLVKDPHSTAFSALSDIYRTFGLHEEAVAVAQKGTEMVPTYVPGFISLGRALAEKGDPGSASSAYQRALALDPGNLAALTGLASSCLGCGQSEEALALLQRARLIDPDDEVVRQLFPVVQKLAAISAVPPSPVIQVPSQSPPIQASPEVSHVDLVEEVDRKSVAAPLPPIATATLADIYIKQGFSEKALKVYTDLLLEDPDNAEIRQRYDELYQKINAPTVTVAPVTEIIVPIEVEPEESKVDLPAMNGKEALVVLYNRWLDAVNRRRSNVH